MPQTPSRADADAVVHLPHQPLPSYYASDDLEAREKFLRATFDDTAVDYNRLERILGLGTGTRYRRFALQRAGLKPGMQVVDVGMGTGLVSQEILRITQEPARLIGVDPSPGMMAQARLPAGVECRLGRAEEIPVPDASADFLVMGYALRHIADFSVACAEFRRVLKPGGRLLILEITKAAEAAWHRLAEGLHARCRAAGGPLRVKGTGHADVVALLLGHHRHLRGASAGAGHTRCRRSA